MIWKNIFSGLSGRNDRATAQSLADPFALERPLLRFSPDPIDVWDIRDSLESVLILGGSGSGKSSGSARTIARALLGAGFGGLVLCAKPDERVVWERYARQTNRENDLIIFSPEQPWRFNFLNYLLSRPGRGAGHTENILNCFCTILEIAERKNGHGSNEQYWQRAMKQLLRNAIDLLAIAKRNVSLPDLYRLVTSAPQNIEQCYSADWQRQSLCFQCIVEADERNDKDPIQEHALKLSSEYWLSEFPTIAPKTRSIIVSTFTTMADIFLRGIMHQLFCTSLNITPEVTLDGKILVIDLNVKQFGELGQFSQVLWKYMWQQFVEGRNITDNSRPVFLWADECQNFITSYDREFQSTARSSRACTVYITQNLPNLYSELGGDNQARVATDALLGNLATKIFHANSESSTVEWSANLISRSLQYRYNYSASGTERRSSPSSSSGFSQSYDYLVEPRTFSSLKMGGPQNDGCVEGIVFQNGRVWANGQTYLKVQFQQEQIKE